MARLRAVLDAAPTVGSRRAVRSRITVHRCVTELELLRVHLHQRDAVARPYDDVDRVDVQGNLRELNGDLLIDTARRSAVTTVCRRHVPRGIVTFILRAQPSHRNNRQNQKNKPRNLQRAVSGGGIALMWVSAHRVLPLRARMVSVEKTALD